MNVLRMALAEYKKKGYSKVDSGRIVLALSLAATSCTEEIKNHFLTLKEAMVRRKIDGPRFDAEIEHLKAENQKTLLGFTLDAQKRLSKQALTLSQSLQGATSG